MPTHAMAATSGSVFHDFKAFTLSAVARSRQADPETLDSIARRGDFDLCLLVAGNPKTSAETLNWIVESGLPEFRRHQRGDQMVRRLAEHKAISVAAIAKLVRTYDGLCPAVLDILAGNRQLTAAMLAELAASEDVFVRRVAARHPNTPPTVLRNLLEAYFPSSMEPGSIEWIRFKAQSKHPQKALVPMAHNPAAPIEVLRRLADRSLHDFLSSTSYVMDVWTALVMNPQFRGRERMELLGRLLESSDGLEIVGRVMSLTEVTEDEAREFVQELSGEYVGLLLLIDVSRYLKRASEEKRKRTEKNWAIVHRRIALSPDRGHRNLLAMSRLVDQDLLRLLAHDAETSVRLKVASNQAAPRDVLTLLSTDSDRGVRDAVLQTLWMYWPRDGAVQTSA